jgi:putative transposase
MIQRGFKTELDPNNKQATLLLKNAGAARWAFNWGLEQKKKALGAKERIPNAIELHRRLNQLKKTEIPWAYDCSKCSFQEALRNLDKAFDNFWKSRKGKRKGKKIGFPKFKSRKKGIGGFRLTGAIHVFADRIQLPRIGTVRLKEANYIPSDAKILNASVSERAGRWFVSVQVETPEPQDFLKKDEHDIIGTDLGIKTLAVCSDGQQFQSPKSLSRKLRKLRKFSKSHSKKQKGSNRRKKAAAKLAKLHYRISCIRRDSLHKITTILAKTKRVIGIENLNITGMLRNRHLSRAISDLGLSEWRRQLTYKAQWYGCQLVIANRFFPSSKTCSDCGWVNQDLSLADREWICDTCGVIHDRDMNAARNLEYLARSSQERLNARGEASSGSPKMVSETGFDEARMERESA